MPNGDAIVSLTDHVYGMDVHPVAVTLARVTYLLAIGASRLAQPDRGPITVPIYLGDSLQWEQSHDLLSGRDVVTISTSGDDLVEGGGGVMFGDDLIFPRSVLQEAASFDQLVTAMADKAADKTKRSAADVVRPVMRQFGIHDADVPVLTETFATMRRLQASGRDHIWGYYVRNLIRPLWLAEPQNQVDVLIGNPPWLRYSKMLASMQQRYKALAKERNLLSGPLGAAGRDLSTLFVTRAIELYLKPEGEFGFVMPHGTLTRKPHAGFRFGKWGSADAAELTVTFDRPWDLVKAPTGFPMVSCVVFGQRTIGKRRAMPADVQKWSAKLKSSNTSWAAAKDKFTITNGTVHVLGAANPVTPSPYRTRFRNGAILYPRFLLFVEEAGAGPLGAGAGRVAVTSRRTTSEKKPWKELPSISATVERAFVHPVHLGETLLPFRLLPPLRAVLPTTTKTILSNAKVDENAGLAAWWSLAEEAWRTNRVDSEESDLIDRIDFHGQLSAQLPATKFRVAYTASGNTLAAARIDDPHVIVEHKLYWANASNIDEARYLTGILNSQTVLDRVKPLQNLGLFGARDFDKNVFHVPIPMYDASNDAHKLLADIAADAERSAAAVDISLARDFKRARVLVRAELESSGWAAKLEAAVATVIPPILLPDSGPSQKR